MEIDDASNTSSPASSDRPSDPNLDELILPSLRHRLRVSLLFLAVAQTLAVALLVSQGAGQETRAVINAFRILTLYWCVWALRGRGDRRDTLMIGAIGIGAQLACGVAISIVRQDVLPTALLMVALSSTSSVFIPWGARVQAAYCALGAAGFAVATLTVSRMEGRLLNFDSVLTMAVSMLVSISIAFFLERSRRQLEHRLEEARRTDDELAALRGQLERRVAERTAELEMANRELEGFSYTVSHDLRSPLRTIAGFSQVILDEQGDQLEESVRASLLKIRAASRRMDGLIDDMLLLARVGRGALRHETVDLAALARSIGEDLAAEQPERKVELVVGPIPPVSGDHALLRIALDNLLRNAWKFTAARETAHVRVSGEAVGDNVVVRVEDDGIGFDVRFRGKLFQPFERIHGDDRFPGTGVGLATVARIVHRHGGEVEADGALGRGATFSIALPNARAK